MGIRYDLVCGVTNNMSLQVVASSCTAGSCPTIYRTDSGSVVVQGYFVPAERTGVEVPDGEMLVEIPAELLAEAHRAIS
ncbi:hypothetical protein GCM10023107_08190 [Actinoplanes octamycinicus]|nr:hypothetical protein Aoc01nite_09720 [Actinoplanes octamycinicus]